MSERRFPLPRVDWTPADSPEAAVPDDDVAPVVPWSTFLAGLDWRQGEHVTLVGPTGGGKTSTAIRLLPKRDWVVTFATKPVDATLDQLVEVEGYKRVSEWPPGPPLDDDQVVEQLDDAAPDEPSHWFWSAGVDSAPQLVEVDDRLASRVILWPAMRRLADVQTQRAVFLDAIDDIFAAGGWTIFADELAYLTSSEFVDLSDELKLIWQQGRSIGISLVVATQRPAWVPLEAYSQATHVFFWRASDRRDLDRIAGLGAHDPAVIRDIVRQLRQYQVLYVNTRTGQLVRTTPDPPAER